MSLTLFHGLSKSQEQMELTKNASMILIYQIYGKTNVSGVYKRKQKYQNKAKTEHTCRESDSAKQTCGP